MKLPKLHLRDLFWLVLVCALGCAWWRGVVAREPAILSAKDLAVGLDPFKPFTSESLPVQLRRLEASQVRIDGFMHGGSIFRKGGIKEFLLTTHPPSMTFGSGEPVDGVVAVQMRDGTSTSYTTRPVRVTGTLRFREYRPERELVLIYWLEKASIQSVP